MFVNQELDILIHWIMERERIRVRKNSNEDKPWTQDALLQNYRFCNVKRMDDKVSVWLLENWYPMTRYTGSEIYTAVLARAINWPDALECIATELDSVESVKGRLKERKNSKEKVFTGAYIVPGVKGQEKIDSVIALAERVKQQPCETITKVSMRDTWRWLLSFDGLGTFLAGQIVADLACLRSGSNWPDTMEWAPVGPGSARGLNRLMGIKKTANLTQERFEPLLKELIKEIRPSISSIWHDRQLCAMDIQNCLCEFDKYRRLTLQEGTVRAKYPGQSNQNLDDSPQEQLVFFT